MTASINLVLNVSKVFTGIPDYDRVFLSGDIVRLNARPLASRDFKSNSAVRKLISSCVLVMKTHFVII